jgi:VWFA-related protein
MSNLRRHWVARSGTALVFLLFSISLSEKLSGQAPTAPDAPSPNTPTKTEPLPPQEVPASEDSAEVSSHDTPATFKVRVNLVLLRVVVRDAQGKVVPNLHKEDFQLFDNRKAQTITTFNVETLESHTASTVAASTSAEASSSSADVAGGRPVVLPQRFVAMVFDDVHMSIEDSSFVRDSATRFLAGIAPSDRIGVYTTSGQFALEFTDDLGALHQALLGIIPRHPTSGTGFHDCPDISYFQADLIVNKNDTQAMAVATEDAIQCAFNGDTTQTIAARSMAQAASLRALAAGDAESEYGYRHLGDIARRLGSMPGQRVLVLVSPGFIHTTLQLETSDIVDRATRANIVINTIDARGLYAPDVLGDIADPPHDSFRTVGYKSTYRIAAQSAQEEVLGQLADGTGGRFFHNRNDVDEAMREAAAAPAFSYLLGFSPQNMKVDGRFHTLKVTFTGKEKYSIQARHGYFAPKSINDPAQAAKEEIQEALFSQEEIHDLPIDLQTQFFKKSDAEAKLAVLTHLTLKGIRFRKADGRNRDDLTIVTGIFDENGNFVTGGEKVVEMKLLDTTYERLSRFGLTVKSSFDVKPGTYMVRLVVRGAEGDQMAARNGAVVIPY